MPRVDLSAGAVDISCVKAMAAAVIAFLVVALSGCATGIPCDHEKCGGPARVPASIIRLTINGTTYDEQDGASRALSVHAGAAVPIVLSIASPSGAAVRDVIDLSVSYLIGDFRTGWPLARMSVTS